MKTAQIEVDLPMLINHCGKLRMLSHRFVMMLSLCQQGVPRKAEYFAAAQEALKGLKTTARYFVNPEAVRDNLDHAALYLKHAPRGDCLGSSENNVLHYSMPRFGFNFDLTFHSVKWISNSPRPVACDHAAFHASTLLYRCRVSALISPVRLSEAN